MPKISNIGKKADTDFLVKPVIEFLYLIDELNKAYKNQNIQSFMEEILSKVGSNLKRAKIIKSFLI